MLITITKRKCLANGYSVVKELSPFSPHKGKWGEGFFALHPIVLGKARFSPLLKKLFYFFFEPIHSSVNSLFGGVELWCNFAGRIIALCYLSDFSRKIRNTENLDFTGFSAEFLAFPRWLEHPTYRLGGGRSIQLSYGNIYKNYEIVELATFSLPSQGGRWNTFLGGGHSILLSYSGIYEKFFTAFPGEHISSCPVISKCFLRCSKYA